MISSVELKKALEESIPLDGKLVSTLDSQRLGIYSFWNRLPECNGGYFHPITMNGNWSFQSP